MSKEEKLQEEQLNKEAEETEAEEPQEQEAAEEAAQAAEGESPDTPGQEKTPTKEEEDLQTQYLRLAADFQNYKRRSEKEKSDIYAYANEKFALDLLEAIDNFDRALDAQVTPADEKYAEGMQLIYKQLLGVLEKNRIEEIKAEGAAFDPNYHNAVMTEEAGEGVESGTVTKVFQKGYTLSNKVIRPAMVAVAQ